MITLRFNSIDSRTTDRRTFKTLAGARKAAHARVGKHPEGSWAYAISSDGIVRVTCEGCTLAELFPSDEAPKPEHSDFFVVAGMTYGTFAEAKAEQELLIAQGYGHVEIEKYNTLDAYGDDEGYLCLRGNQHHSFPTAPRDYDDIPF